MKKINTILLALSALVLLSSADKVVKNDYFRPEKFAGKVKSITETEYFRGANSEGGLNDTFSWSRTEKINFDKSGKEIERASYNEKGVALFIDTINYDAKGNRLERAFYNKSGALVKKIIYRYDDLGRKIEEHHNRADGSLEHNVTYKYDERGNCIEWDSYNSRGVLVGKQIFTYDKDDINTEEKWWFLADSTQNLRSFYTYNSDGKEIERKAYPFSSDSLKYKDNTTYDAKGNVIKMERTNAKGEVVDGLSNTFKHEYDPTGNWIKKEITVNGQIGLIIKREIEYYK